MTLSVQDYAGRARDSKWERQLAQDLRNSSEEEKLKFIGDFVEVNPIVALEVARKCLSENRSYQALLDRALNEADSSGIRYWLECVVPRLGVRRVVTHLRSQVAMNPRGVANARYWLSMFSKLPGYSQAEIDAIELDRNV